MILGCLPGISKPENARLPLSELLMTVGLLSCIANNPSSGINSVLLSFNKANIWFLVITGSGEKYLRLESNFNNPLEVPKYREPSNRRAVRTAVLIPDCKPNRVNGEDISALEIPLSNAIQRIPFLST